MEAEKESMGTIVDETCVDAVHPRIKSITNKAKRKDKSKSQSNRHRIDVDDDGRPIIESSSGSSSSLSPTVDTSLTCSSCGLPDHPIAKEWINLNNNVVLIRTLNCDGSITSRFIFPPNSQRKSYLPKRSSAEAPMEEEEKGIMTDVINSCCKQ